ncbi:MAG: photosystem II stability/assembly factor-like uncharacterized protein [Flavobacteriales bacterium]|jgi:photosystem II stability/assembly factor-like uncharacterized protein
MRRSNIFLAILLSGIATNVSAQGQFDLLQIPALKSDIANKSIITSIIQHKNQVLAVGERGHVLTWTDMDNWQQQTVPVSLTLTGITTLNDGTRFVVGHDSIILKSEPKSDKWSKVFDGNELTKLKITYIGKKIISFQERLEELTDENEIADLQYDIEDLEFNLEDAQVELENGPNKPLLGITVNDNDQLFAVGAYGTLLTSVDLGDTWQLIDGRVQNPSQYHLNSIVTADNGFMYIVGENGLGFSSINNGQTWQTMDMPYDGSLFGITAKQNSLVAFGLQGNFMVSNDNGQSWKASNIGSSASLLGGVIADDMTVSLVGHGGIIVRFNVNDISNLSLHRHPSSAVFSSVVIRDNSLVLAGQFGMTTWLVK